MTAPRHLWQRGMQDVAKDEVSVRMIPYAQQFGRESRQIAFAINGDTSERPGKMIIIQNTVVLKNALEHSMNLAQPLRRIVQMHQVQLCLEEG